MNHRQPLATLVARSAAIMGILTVLALAGALFALYVHPAHAQEGSAPAKPTGLFATATHDQVVLTWDDPGDDSITGYVILRRVRENDTGGEFCVLVPDTGTAATTYTDDIVAASTTYTYRLKGDQRARGERALPLVPHRHSGGAGGRRRRRAGRGGRRRRRARAMPRRPGPGELANVSQGDTELPATTATTGRVEVGGSVTGRINSAGDHDWFAAALSVADSAPARTEQTLVSNLDTSSSSFTQVSSSEYAQQFRNGSEARALLSAVEAYAPVPAGSDFGDDLRVSLWSSVSGAPGEELVAFTNPSNMSTKGVKTLTNQGPGTLILQPNTSLFRRLFLQGRRRELCSWLWKRCRDRFERLGR